MRKLGIVSVNSTNNSIMIISELRNIVNAPNVSLGYYLFKNTRIKLGETHDK